MTEEEIILFDSLEDLLTALVGTEGKRTGKRKELAAAMGCQATYLSQVLKGRANMSLEQGLSLGTYYGWTQAMIDFSLLLVQKSRAGSKSLEEYFDSKILEFRNLRTRIEKRVTKTRDLTDSQRNQYYSSWLYAAVHIALSIPQLQSDEAILEHFCAPSIEIRKVLQFLEETGLAERNGKKIAIGPTHIHLGKDSHLLCKHLTHWRIRAIDSVDTQLSDQVHYSVVMSLAEEDVIKCKEILVQAIETCNKLVADSAEETLYCQNIDFFKL